jgi:hypothetical protein
VVGTRAGNVVVREVGNVEEDVVVDNRENRENRTSKFSVRRLSSAPFAL